MGQAHAKKSPVAPAPATPVKARPNLRLVPVLKLGVGKDLLERGPVQMLCRASQGGSCDINCTTDHTG